MMRIPLTILLLVAMAAGCRQKMAEQPGYRREQPSDFFGDGASVRPLPEGAVAREWRRSDDPLMSGLKPAFAAAARERPPGGTEPAPDAPVDPERFAVSAPFPLTREDLVRGQLKYTIYCAVCHGATGDGDGKVVERGYLKPPSYHADPSRGFARYGKVIPLRAVPLGYIFQVVTRGYGAMPQYAAQIEAKDRWRIAGYVRALQLSQRADLAELPQLERDAARRGLGVAP